MYQILDWPSKTYVHHLYAFGVTPFACAGDWIRFGTLNVNACWAKYMDNSEGKASRGHNVWGLHKRIPMYYVYGITIDRAYRNDRPIMPRRIV